MCSAKPTVHCRIFEDNSGALEITKVPKMRPRTKHIKIKYHHFRDFVGTGEISLHAITNKVTGVCSSSAQVQQKLLTKLGRRGQFYLSVAWGGIGVLFVFLFFLVLVQCWLA